MQDVVLVDERAEPVRPVILYSDTRAHHEAAAIEADLGGASLQRLTGNEQTATGLLAKLRWLRQHEPTSLTAARSLLLGAADYLALRLTGRSVTDTTTASTTGLLALATRGWLDRALLERAVGAPIDRLLPDLVAGGSRVGKVSREAAAALGVAAGTPVFLGPGDAAATTLGVGSGTPGRPYAYIGTSGWVAYSSATAGDPARGVFTLAHPLRGLFVCVAPLLTAGGNFDWIKDLTGAADHGTMIAEALALPPSELLYLPYLRGERSPISDPFARGAFIGLDMGHGRLDLTRAVLQGVAFAYRHAVDALIGADVERLIVTGGGTRSPEVCKLLADVIGVEVVVPEGAVHSGLLGALAATGLAGADAAAAAFSPRAANRYRPDPELKRSYDASYRRFRLAYPALEGVFAREA
jgi:xylulokinase